MLRVLLFAMTAFLLNGSTHSSDGRIVFVSLTEKNSVATFFNRLSTENHQLVSTSQEPRNALESVRIELAKRDQLLIVERLNEEELIPGSVATIGKFSMVVMPRTNNETHVHLGDIRNHVFAVGDLEQVAPPEIDQFFDFPEDGFSFPEISPDYLEEKLAQFSGATPTTVAGKKVTITERGSNSGRTLAIEWLKEQYESLGFAVSEHKYRTGSNFIAELEGEDPSRYIILSAHLDSVSNPGADDDGAGTITALAIAEVLSKQKLKYNLRILGFDQEERGLIGSSAYAKDLNNKGAFEGLIGVFNLEMTGYDEDSDGAYHVIDCNENTSAELSKLVEAGVEELGIELTKSNACTSASDHSSFWRYNQPAIVVSQNFFKGDSNPCYHRSCDKIDILHFDYMAKITQAVGAGIAAVLVGK